MHIKVGDTVQVIAGNDRGSRGKVLKVSRQTGKLVVEGMNRVFKHMRRSQRNPQGGRLSKEMPIQLSNVMLVCTSCNKPARTGARIGADGSKTRFCKKCNAEIGRLSPAKESRAKLATAGKSTGGKSAGGKSATAKPMAAAGGKK
jgi:large subunit ribosomal protein L24